MPYTVDPVIPTFIAFTLIVILVGVLYGLRHRNDRPPPPVPLHVRILPALPMMLVAVSGLVLSAFGYRHPSWWDWLILSAALIGLPIYYTLRRRAQHDADAPDGSM